LVVAVGTASAQNYSTDARKIAMGGGGGESTNIAAGMVGKASPYTSIVLPLGILQLLSDGFDKFKPSSDQFDPIAAIENATNPLHYTFGRGTTGTGQTFVNDIRNGNFNTNLLSYVGFKIPAEYRAQGLGMPQGGGTIKFAKRPTGAFQGIYVGAGPYMSFDTNGTVSQPLVDMLATGVGAVCNPCLVDNASRLQLGMAITVGYRGRVALASSQDSRDGVYVAYNYHILRGFRYLDNGVDVRLDTTAGGQYQIPPPGTNPIFITTLQAKSGSGRASDIGVVVVRNNFEVGFGINGIGNSMEWTDFSQDNYFMATSLQTGLEFSSTSVTPPVSSLTVKLPIVISESLAFQAGGWGFMGTLAQKKAGSGVAGYGEKSMSAGIERKFGPFWLRGGGRYAREKWDPTYGFGIGNRIALDVGFYGTHANLEGKRQTAMAISLRFNRGPARGPGEGTGTTTIKDR